MTLSLDPGMSVAAARRASLLPRAAGFLRDLIRYGFASAAALAVDCGVLALARSLGADYRLATAAGFLCGLGVIYLLSMRFVFAGRRRLDFGAEWVVFLATGVAGLALTEALMAGFVDGLGLSVPLAKAPTVALVFLFNFLSRRALCAGRSA